MNWLILALLSPLVLNAQSITGKVVDVIPSPLPNAPVGLLPVGGDGVTQSAHTAADGSFRFFPVEPGDYVVIARRQGFQSRVLAVHVVAGKEAELGALELKVGSCDIPGVNCDYFGAPPPPRPPVPVVDLCEALKGPDRYGNRLLVMVGMLSTLNGWPTLTATCESVLASVGLTWANVVLLPEAAAPQRSPTLPNIPDLKKKLAGLAAAVRRTNRSAASRVVAVYGFLDMPDGLQAVPCTSDSRTRPDIRMPPASFLRVDGFQELK